MAEELTTKALSPVRRTADEKVAYLGANSKIIGGSSVAANVAEGGAKTANEFEEGKLKEGAVCGAANGGPELNARGKATVGQVAHAARSAAHGPPTMAVRSGAPPQAWSVCECKAEHPTLMQA